MAKDPAFLFYPGDYLRDTQCLSDKSQVAYDRIMCEHMRNISEDMNNITVTKNKVDFFTKRLTDEEKAELMHVLTSVNDNFQIYWVAESICKRKSYSDSRAKNRIGKNKEDMKTYDSDMENANEDYSTLHNKVKIGEKNEKNSSDNLRAQSENIFLRRISERESKINRNGQKDS